jgi:hypothetical protein
VGGVQGLTKEDYLLFRVKPNCLTTNMASMSIKDQYIILALLVLIALWIKALLKPFKTQLVYYPSIYKYSDMPGGKMVLSISHLHLPFKDYKWIKDSS